MALKRATKSIPLTGGIVEEVDDFLLEPSGMRYMENLRYTRKDVAEKIKPHAGGVSTGAASYSTDANGFWSRGDRVAVIGNNEVAVSADGGATFDVTTQTTDLLGIESIIRAGEERGGTNYSWAPCGEYTDAATDTFVITCYVVAFERVDVQPTSLSNTRSVVIQIYDLDGTLLEETIREASCNPVCRPDNNQVRIAYINVNNDRIEIDVVANTSRTLINVGNYAAGLRHPDPQVFEPTNETYGPVGTPLLFGNMRLGYSRNLANGYNNCMAMHSSMWAGDTGVLAAKFTSGWIQVTLTDGNGFPTGGLVNVAQDADPLFRRVLDVHDDGTTVYVMYSTTNVTAGTPNRSNVNIWAAPRVGAGGPWVYTVGPNIDGDIINGSLCAETPTTHGGSGDDHIFAAWTVAAGEPDDTMITTDGLHRVMWAEIDPGVGLWSGATNIESGNIYSHRLVGNLAVDKNGYGYACVQQWSDWNPDPNKAVGGNPDQAGLTPGHKKPVTTVLVRLNNTEYNEVIASFDAGQSKVGLAGEDETNEHLGGALYYWNQGTGAVGAHQFWFGNRVQAEPTDDFFFLHNATSGALPTTDERVTLHVGTGRFNVFRLQSSIDVRSVNFVDGAFMGTAVPSWFDGAYELSCATPLDSPEVCGYSGDGDMASWGAWSDLSVSGEEAKVIQLVYGYVDDSGVTHRSAPSLPFYIGNAEATTTTGFHLSVHVTPPLDIARTRQYFLEGYEAKVGEIPQLCGVKQIPANARQKITFNWLTNVNPTTGVEDIDVFDFRSSKQIYTTGNVLAADPWPHFDAVVRSARRLFAHSITDPSTIYYTKTFENGIAPEFSATLTASLGNEVITAIGAIDDKVLLFTADGTYVMYGTGPDNTGANGDFFFEKLVWPVGCTDQDSILTTDNGIAFYSSTTQEFHLIGRDLQLVDIGENVKDLSEDITDVRHAIVNPQDHELRWYCDATSPSSIIGSLATTPPGPPRVTLKNSPPVHPVFVFNYKYGKWSLFDEASAESMASVLVNNSVALLSTSWVFQPEDLTTWDTNAKLSRWETPWIKVNQLQDFGRFYRATFLGKYLSSWTDNGNGVESGDLQVQIVYDYEGTDRATDTYRFRAQRELSRENGERLQFDVKPSRQKCQAIKFIITEVATTAIEVWEPTYTTGRGFSLTSVDLHYGAKGGPSRLPAGRNK